MDEKIKKTPLNSWHRENGANMADFGGFDMPLWYETGVKQEHLAVIQSAGIFDTSHMACVTAEGKDALELLQHCHTRDLAPLRDGRCGYGAILDGNGHVIDDAIVYRFNQTNFMVCVNAGMGKAVADHLEHHKDGRSVAIEDLSEMIAKIDIQGKNAAKILAGMIDDPDGVFDTMPYFSFKGHYDEKALGASAVRLKDKTSLLLSRSGYTGEFGFELFVPASRAVKLWNMILDAGRALDVIPCGLGARDSLRAGAVLPLSHQDIGPWPFVNHPWPFALALNSNKTGFTKEFVGKEALEKAMADPGTGFTHAFAGDNLRKIGTGAKTEVVDSQGNNIGRVLTCATDMAIGWHNNRILSMASPDLPEGFKPRGISCGFVLVNRKLTPGERFTLREKKRKITVTIVDDVRPHRTARKKIGNFR